MAIGRDARTDDIGLDTVGVERNPKNKKLMVNSHEQTNVPHVFALGDVADGKPELTPVAIQAGRLLSQRLYGGKRTLVSLSVCPRNALYDIDVSTSVDSSILFY